MFGNRNEHAMHRLACVVLFVLALHPGTYAGGACQWPCKCLLLRRGLPVPRSTLLPSLSPEQAPQRPST